MELSGEFPAKLLCDIMGIRRSSFYHWKQRLAAPADRRKNLVSNVALFQQYHLKFPSHGYRWLRAKILLDTGLVVPAPLFNTITFYFIKVNIVGISGRFYGVSGFPVVIRDDTRNHRNGKPEPPANPVYSLIRDQNPARNITG